MPWQQNNIRMIKWILDIYKKSIYTIIKNSKRFGPDSTQPTSFVVELLSPIPDFRLLNTICPEPLHHYTTVARLLCLLATISLF